jgi:hypothetical protein
MKVPEEFDFSRLFEGSADAEIIPREQVPARLRELADQLERGGKPRLVLWRVYSFQATGEHVLADNTLVLKFGRFFEPPAKRERFRKTEEGTTK